MRLVSRVLGLASCPLASGAPFALAQASSVTKPPESFFALVHETFSYERHLDWRYKNSGRGEGLARALTLRPWPFVSHAP